MGECVWCEKEAARGRKEIGIEQKKKKRVEKRKVKEIGKRRGETGRKWVIASLQQLALGRVS